MTILVRRHPTIPRADQPVTLTDGRIPYWDYFGKAYEYASRHESLKEAIAVEFDSMDHALSYTGAKREELVKV